MFGHVSLNPPRERVFPTQGANTANQNLTAAQTIFQENAESFRIVNLLTESNLKEATTEENANPMRGAFSSPYSGSYSTITQIVFSPFPQPQLPNNTNSIPFEELPLAKKARLNEDGQEESHLQMLQNHYGLQEHTFYGQASVHRPAKLLIPASNSNPAKRKTWEELQVNCLQNSYQKLTTTSGTEGSVEALDIAKEISTFAQGDELKAACYLLKIAAEVRLKWFREANADVEEALMLPLEERFTIAFQHLQLLILFQLNKWANILEVEKKFDGNIVLNSQERSMIATAHLKVAQHHMNQAEENLRTLLLEAKTEQDIRTGFSCWKSICADQFGDVSLSRESGKNMLFNIHDSSLQNLWKNLLRDFCEKGIHNSANNFSKKLNQIT